MLNYVLEYLSRFSRIFLALSSVPELPEYSFQARATKLQAPATKFQAPERYRYRSTESERSSIDCLRNEALLFLFFFLLLLRAVPARAPTLAQMTATPSISCSSFTLRPNNRVLGFLHVEKVCKTFTI